MNWHPLLPKDLLSLKTLRLRVVFKAAAEGSLPAYLGSTLRGVLAMSYRRMVCTYDMRPCDGCPVQTTCPYTLVFETPNATDQQNIRRLRDIPHPIVIEPPYRHPRKYKPGDELIFQLVLIGKGIRYLPYLLFALREMGGMGLGSKRIPFHLDRVFDRHGKVIYREEEGIFHEETHPMTVEQLIQTMNGNRDYNLRLITPLRIKKDGHFMHHEFDIKTFLTHACRRLRSMLMFHDNVVSEEVDFRPLLNECDYPQVVESQLRWLDRDRYSNRQKQSMKMGGMVGHVHLKGDLKPWLPILAASQELHVGKGTIMGLGQISFEEIE